MHRNKAITAIFGGALWHIFDVHRFRRVTSTPDSDTFESIVIQLPFVSRCFCKRVVRRMPFRLEAAYTSCICIVIFFSFPLQKPLSPTPPRPHPTPRSGPETDPKQTRNGAKRSRTGPKRSQKEPKWTEIKLFGVGRAGGLSG